MALRRLTPPDGGPGTTDHVLMHDGLPRAYRVHLPPKLPIGAPLVIQLHGGGGNGRGLDRLTRFQHLADRARFAVASPTAIAHRWNDGTAAAAEATDRGDPPPLPGRPPAALGRADDVGFLTTLIDCLAGWLPVDRHRVYAVGISNGAMMSARLAAERPDRVAAIGQVAGTISADAPRWWHPARPVPVIQIHGTADPILPYSGGDVQLRRQQVRSPGQERSPGQVRSPGQERSPGRVLGVDRWADLVVAANRAAGPEVTTPAPGVTVRTWRGPTPEADVEFWRVEAAGHTWAGGVQYLPERLIGPTSQAFDATAVLWHFLAAHIRE